LIHDIGLLGFPEELMHKEIHQMSDEEGRLYSDHPTIASILLENVEKLSDVGEIVLYHHEYFDGSGFPNGLSGDQIPLGSRIILAASDYCQILSTWPRDLRKLIAYTRRHFDADIWKSFTVSDDPDTIIEEAAEKKLLMECNQKYDVEVVSALIKKIRENKKIDPTFVVELNKVKAGMVLMEDLKLNDGRLLLTKGTKLKATSIESIISIGERGLIPNTLTVSVPDEN